MWEYWPVLVARRCHGRLRAAAQEPRAHSPGAGGVAGPGPNSGGARDGARHAVGAGDGRHCTETRPGRRGAQHGPAPDTIIATRAAGMAYFPPGLRVIDQWGLNDPVVFAFACSGIRTRGMSRQASRDYLGGARVNLEFGHPMLCRCSQPRKTDPAQRVHPPGQRRRMRALTLT